MSVNATIGRAMSPVIQPPGRVWRSVRFWVNLAYVWLLLAAVPDLIVRYWFLGSVGQPGVFWTNFAAQLALCVAGTVAFTVAVAAPIRRYAATPTLRTASLHVALWIGVLAGWLWSMRYEEYLLALAGGSFGELDPVFGRDVGFYVFTLPAIRTTRLVVAALALAAAASAIVGRLDQVTSDGRLHAPGLTVGRRLGLLVTPGLNVALLALGLSLAAQTFLTRYGLLFKDNGDAGVRAGAAFLDVEGLFSTLNMINVSTAVELVIMAAVGLSLHRIGRASASVLTQPIGDSTPVAPSVRFPAMLFCSAIAIDLAFFLGVVVKDHLVVAPNEPTIQLPYIERHIAATTRGYRLNDIETVDWRPPEAPLSAERLLASRTVRNAPLLPGWVSSLEAPPDVQHYERVMATGSTQVYGPMLQVYEQEQQLRPYYKFLSVDHVRYRIEGEKQMFVSAVRELPSIGFLGPREWLRHWGSASLMLTHGLGLVMSPVNELKPEGGPRYVVSDIPPKATHPALEAEPRIYFGEGAKDDYILTDIRHLKELDQPTRQFRSEGVYAPPEASGIPVDSVLTRVVLALYTKDINQFLFSRFVDHDRTRAHFFRTPLQRVSTIAPFLFLDSNIFAFVSEGKTLWMMNGLTTTDAYPYSYRERLGDKADERSVEAFPERTINYGEDSAKVTLDAYTGQVRFYKIADDPIVNTWARIYPGLFERAESMPEPVSAQLTYPLQWFHIQFDDIYKRYHQQHPVEFYNAEDLWDDADEVVGSIGRGLTEFGTGDQMTFSYEGYDVLLDPADVPQTTSLGRDGDLQFAKLMPFTPEGARNLRSLVVALQDPGTYGRLLNLRVPQGVFVAGPEQADTLIDDDSQVNQQITLWVRHGSEVVRGHTLLLPVGGDLVYVEPLWIVSLQNQLPQVKLVSVVYRGRTTMATSLADALRLLAGTEADEQRANQIPWLLDAQATGR